MLIFCCFLDSKYIASTLKPARLRVKGFDSITDKFRLRNAKLYAGFYVRRSCTFTSTREMKIHRETQPCCPDNFTRVAAIFVEKTVVSSFQYHISVNNLHALSCTATFQCREMSLITFRQLSSVTLWKEIS